MKRVGGARLELPLNINRAAFLQPFPSDLCQLAQQFASIPEDNLEIFHAIETGAEAPVSVSELPFIMLDHSCGDVP